MKIKVEADCAAPIEACWEAAVNPAAIKVWNAATPDWHCPSAEVDLRVGGKMVSRMEAVDGSMGFDFAATFTAIDAPFQLEYELDDGRMVELLLKQVGNKTHISQTFDAESENSAEMQKTGWQAILDSYVRYLEGHA